MEAEEKGVHIIRYKEPKPDNKVCYPPRDEQSIESGNVRIHYPSDSANIPEYVLNALECVRRSRAGFPVSKTHYQPAPLKGTLKTRASNTLAGSSHPATQAVRVAIPPFSKPTSGMAGTKRKRSQDDDGEVRPTPPPPVFSGSQVLYAQIMPYTDGPWSNDKEARISFAPEPADDLTRLAAQRFAENLTEGTSPVPVKSTQERAAKRVKKHLVWAVKQDPAVAQLSKEIKTFLDKVVECAETPFQQQLAAVFLDTSRQMYPHCPAYAQAREEATTRLQNSEEFQNRQAYWEKVEEYGVPTTELEPSLSEAEALEEESVPSPPPVASFSKSSQRPAPVVRATRRSTRQLAIAQHQPASTPAPRGVKRSASISEGSESTRDTKRIRFDDSPDVHRAPPQQATRNTRSVSALPPPSVALKTKERAASSRPKPSAPRPSRKSGLQIAPTRGPTRDAAGQRGPRTRSEHRRAGGNLQADADEGVGLSPPI